MVDLDGDGLVDRLYIGDLEGKLWKLVLDGPGRQSPNTWKLYLFDAGDSNDSMGFVNGLRLSQSQALRSWMAHRGSPIFILVRVRMTEHRMMWFIDSIQSETMMRLANVARNQKPRMICGLGVRVMTGNMSGLGDGLDNAKMPKEPLEDDDAEGEAGERYWSDPLIVDGSTIFFASLYGKIDVVDPPGAPLKGLTSPPSKSMVWRCAL